LESEAREKEKKEKSAMIASLIPKKLKNSIEKAAGGDNFASKRAARSAAIMKGFLP